MLADRLGSLAEAGVLSRTAGAHGHPEYVLTSKGLALWPAIRSLLAWGDEFYSGQGPRRVFHHAADGGAIAADGRCAACGTDVPVPDLVVSPGPGQDTTQADVVTTALATPHRLLAPIRG